MGARAVKVRELVMAAEAAGTPARAVVAHVQALRRAAVYFAAAAASEAAASASAAAAAAAADFQTFPAALPNETGSDCSHRFRAPSSLEHGSRTDSNSGTRAGLPQLAESDFGHKSGRNTNGKAGATPFSSKWLFFGWSQWAHFQFLLIPAPARGKWSIRRRGAEQGGAGISIRPRSRCRSNSAHRTPGQLAYVIDCRL